MGMDIDYLAAKQSLDKLQKLLEDQPHGEREQIADEIIAFVSKMEIKWKEKETKEKVDSTTPNIYPIERTDESSHEWWEGW